MASLRPALQGALFALVATACFDPRPVGPASDGSVFDVPLLDEPSIDAPLAAFGTELNPAGTCAELKVAGTPSGVYWVRHPTEMRSFQVYCEQDLRGGGWAMLENSVRRDDGTTTAFWQFTYGQRLDERGTIAPDHNYYNGALYLLGTDYMDVFVDLEDKPAIAAVMTTDGIDRRTMRFATPILIEGVGDVFDKQFAAGWSAQGEDGDPYPGNCADDFGRVAQHYGDCWAYSLGADAGVDTDELRLDRGVGPHVNDVVLTSLELQLQPDGGGYSQVKRIARFTRW